MSIFIMMPKILKFSFIFLFSLISCTFSKSYHYIDRPYPELTIRTIPIYIDKDFGPDDIKEIDKALQEWNRAFNGLINLRIASTKFDLDPDEIRAIRHANGFIIVKLEAGNPLVHDEPNKLTFAFVNKIGGYVIYLIRFRMPNDAVFGITMHEIGHLFGARHNENSHLMKEFYEKDEYKCIDKITIQEVANKLNLPIDVLNYCEFN